MAEEDPPGSFGHGIAVGFATCAVLVHVALVAIEGNMADIYRDFGHAQLPAMTRLTLSVPWQLGVPLAAVGLLGALVVRRPRRLGWYVAVAAVLALATVCTYWFPQAPMRELAGNIKAD